MPAGVGVRRLLPVRRYACGARGWGFAMVGGGCGDSGDGAGGLFDHWRVVRPLAGLLAGWAGLVGGVWLVSGSAGGVFAGWRLVRRQWPNTASSGGRSPVWGPTGCGGGDRGHLLGGDGRWRCGLWGTSDTVWGLGTGISCPRSRLGVRAPPCAPDERPDRTDLLNQCTRCRFPGVRCPFRERNTSMLKASQLLERLVGGTPRNLCRHTPQRLRDSCVPSLVGVVWVKSRACSIPKGREALLTHAGPTSTITQPGDATTRTDAGRNHPHWCGTQPPALMRDATTRTDAGRNHPH
ncbi:hypothetical protein EV644_104340 [Kribbella orskensis]|uniref:Uncharacterized protein n=1 Tax=Kribbella orskensis TaxID=2512216 RepID=A0ABY2BQ12_9ACTN|nr:hypothetical protein EV642_103340 [Kribbella sp. VKM Ac-2500]TCO25836.1 hypothetical protein EV644_104340 [Kribbella orskensis]